MKRPGPLKRAGRLRRYARLIRRTALHAIGSRKLRRLGALRDFRQAVLERAGGVCEWCRVRYADDAHHVWPVARGGPDRAWNGAALCRRCHRTVHGTPGSRWIASTEGRARFIRGCLDAALWRALADRRKSSPQDAPQGHAAAECDRSGHGTIGALLSHLRASHGKPQNLPRKGDHKP